MTNSEIKESFLVAKSGDEEAFGRIYDYYYDKLSAYVYRRVLDGENTQDIISNTFFKALKGLKRFKWQGASQFNGWMYRIATNEVNAYFRKKSHYHFSAPEDLEQYFFDNSSTDDVQDDASRKIDLQKDFVEISQVIQELKPKEQTLIHLRFFEDMSMREIAETVNKNENSVRVSLHRILKKLKLRSGAKQLNQLN
ncbi:sigma-70 family RNA polymerase sigma factor [Patescibacteria group bacterium]|nr:sigma-70 family RNA polymerase sigma factor [Patescibacteria group bacterium]